jgi:hypothetical protein
MKMKPFSKHAVIKLGIAALLALETLAPRGSFAQVLSSSQAEDIYGFVPAQSASAYQDPVELLLAPGEQASGQTAAEIMGIKSPHPEATRSTRGKSQAPGDYSSSEPTTECRGGYLPLLYGSYKGKTDHGDRVDLMVRPLIDRPGSYLSVMIRMIEDGSKRGDKISMYRIDPTDSPGEYVMNRVMVLDDLENNSPNFRLEKKMTRPRYGFLGVPNAAPELILVLDQDCLGEVPKFKILNASADKDPYKGLGDRYTKHNGFSGSIRFGEGIFFNRTNIVWKGMERGEYRLESDAGNKSYFAQFQPQEEWDYTPTRDMVDWYNRSQQKFAPSYRADAYFSLPTIDSNGEMLNGKFKAFQRMPGLFTVAHSNVSEAGEEQGFVSKVLIFIDWKAPWHFRKGPHAYLIDPLDDQNVIDMVYSKTIFSR